MKILNKTETPLLARTSFQIIVEHLGKPTPSKVQIMKELTQELQTKENLLVIKKIETKFGQEKSKITAYVYKTEKDLQDIEVKNKKVKKKAENAKEEEAKK